MASCAPLPPPPDLCDKPAATENNSAGMTASMHATMLPAAGEGCKTTDQRCCWQPTLQHNKTKSQCWCITNRSLMHLFPATSQSKSLLQLIFEHQVQHTSPQSNNALYTLEPYRRLPGWRQHGSCNHAASRLRSQPNWARLQGICCKL